ncbi:MAG: hypothetical protein ACHQ7M_05285 [Chloroflexota bacterium]
MPTPLCLLADVQAYTGDATAGTASVYTALIPKVSAAIESYCARTFGQTSYTETRNGNGAERIIVKNRPLTAVASVTINTLPVPAAPDAASFGFVFDDDSIYIRQGQRLSPPPAGAQGGFPVCFERGIQNVVLVYTGGFSAVPADINQAACEWIAYKTAKRTRLDKKSETLAQQTVGFDLSGMPDMVKMLVAPYRITMVPG